MSASDTPHFEELLEHADWVRNLARKLVADAARAEDLVQETWVKALEKPPLHTRNPRAWLGRVVTNLAISWRRSEGRRQHREEASAKSDVAAGEELAREAGLSAELVEEVVGLDEPYRTVLLLRYFRDRTPTQIARELDRSLSTVKTQLQRGLERLRQRLDGRYGDRRSWCALLLPLAQESSKASLVSGPGALLTAGIAIGIGAVAVRFIEAPEHTPSSLASPASELASTSGEASLPAEQLQALGDSGPSQRSEAAVPETVASLASSTARIEWEDALELTSLAGRVLQTNGEPVAGVRLVWVDPARVRWANQQRTIITGENLWLRIDPEERDRLRDDRDEREVFALLNFPRPDLGFALLGGEPAPTYTAWTDEAGRFDMLVPVGGRQIRLEDSELGIIGRSMTVDESSVAGVPEDTWFASGRSRLVGSVLDEDGEPVSGALVETSTTFDPGLNELMALGYGFSSTTNAVRTDAEGNFRFEGLPHMAGVWVEARAKGFESKGQRIELDEEEAQVELRLRSEDAEPSATLSGTVFLANGSPAHRAQVVLGGAAVLTDASGRYQLPIEDFGPNAVDIYATRAGAGIAFVPGAGEGLTTEAGHVRGPDLRLPRTSASIEGRVVDSKGQPVAGAQLSLGTERDRLVRDRAGLANHLEDISAGRTLGYVETDEDGRFRLDGLLERAYRLHVRFGDERTTTSPIQAGEHSLRIEL